MGKHILVPVDSSEQAEKALEYAVGENPDANITLVHAYGLQERAGRGAVVQLTDQALEAAEEHADEVFENAREVAESAGHEGDIETITESGDPEEVITEHAGDSDAIYIGSHGRDGSARILLGSVAEKVVRRSPVPVTVVK